MERMSRIVKEREEKYGGGGAGGEEWNRGEEIEGEGGGEWSRQRKMGEREEESGV